MPRSCSRTAGSPCWCSKATAASADACTLLDLPERPEAGGSEAGAYRARVLEQIRRFGIPTRKLDLAVSTSRCRAGDRLLPAKAWAASRLNTIPGAAHRANPASFLDLAYLPQDTGLAELDSWLTTARRAPDPCSRQSAASSARMRRRCATCSSLRRATISRRNPGCGTCAGRKPATGGGRRPAAPSCRWSAAWSRRWRWPERCSAPQLPARSSPPSRRRAPTAWWSTPMADDDNVCLRGLHAAVYDAAQHEDLARAVAAAGRSRREGDSYSQGNERVPAHRRTILESGWARFLAVVRRRVAGKA